MKQLLRSLERKLVDKGMFCTQKVLTQIEKTKTHKKNRKKNNNFK